jgi:hypothetical protein
MLLLGMILGFIISKKGKLLDPKKIQAIVNMPPPKNPQQIQVFNGMAMVFSLHKFRHYLLGNKFVSYVDHMALV